MRVEQRKHRLSLSQRRLLFAPKFPRAVKANGCNVLRVCGRNTRERKSASRLLKKAVSVRTCRHFGAHNLVVVARESLDETPIGA